MERVCLTVVSALVAVAVSAAVDGQSLDTDLAARARGAAQVVVASIEAVQPIYDVNEFGDTLIVSRASVRVQEVLKGDGLSVGQAIELDVEGGTVGDVTLHVSDMPTIASGEDAILFLTRNRRGSFVPYDRGLGILKLDQTGRVLGSTKTLGDLRPLLQSR